MHTENHRDTNNPLIRLGSGTTRWSKSTTLKEAQQGRAFNAAIDFALDHCGDRLDNDSLRFLRLWRAGDCATIATYFPDFDLTMIVWLERPPRVFQEARA